MDFFSSASEDWEKDFVIKKQDYTNHFEIYFEIENFSIFDNPDRYPRLTFIDCKFENFFIEPNSIYKEKPLTIIFENCEFKSFKTEAKPNFGDNYDEKFEAEQLYLQFKRCFIQEEFEIRSINSIFFHNSFSKYISLSYIKYVEISLGNSNFLLKKSQEYLVSLINDKRIFQNSSNIDLNNFYILNCDNITLRATKEFNNYICSNSKLKINICSIVITKPLEGEIKTFSFGFTKLILEGNFDHKIGINNTLINDLILETFSNAKSSNFYNIKPQNKRDSKLKFIGSNLNNVIFDNFFLNQYETIHFYRNSFENSKFLGCEFPEKLSEFNKIITSEKIDKTSKSKSEDYKVRYETFLQLKNVLEKSGNYYESNKLKAASDEALKNIKNLPCSDAFSLCLNGFTNLHGQSFFRTVYVFLVTTIFLYLLYLCSLGVHFQLFGIFDEYFLKHYFSFIDVTHKSDFINTPNNEYPSTFWSLAIDYLSKIWIAYLVFQFIAAFRKYAKK